MKKMNLKTFFTALLLTVGLVTSAQTVSGIVTSDDGPLPGATVVVKGTSNGVSTDFDGNFSINAPADAILEVSFVGFSSQDVPVNGQDNLTITLAADNELDEVVVTGYGSVTKKDATGAIESIGSDTFDQISAASPAQVLRGKVAGVQITQSNGEPGAGLAIRVRGNTSVRSGNEPLIVVDGVPLAGGNISSGGGAVLGNSSARNPLNFINQNDIESISVLKDAVFTDIDMDGDLDLFVVSGGGEYSNEVEQCLDRDYLNDGHGNFNKSDSTLPVYYHNGSVVKSSDIDNDGDIDYFVGSRSLPNAFGKPPKSFLLENNNGKLTITQNDLFQDVGMVTDGVFLDYDSDGDDDLFLTAEWRKIQLFENDKGKFKNVTNQQFIKNPYGLWQAATPFDVDKDGDLDLVVGNVGLNTKFRASSDYPLKMYRYDFDGNEKEETIVSMAKNGVYYPVDSKEKLSSQLDLLIKKKYTTANEFAGESITDIFEKKILSQASEEIVEELQSGYYKNHDGKFTFIPFDTALQWGPITYIEKLEEASTSNLIMGGSKIDLPPYQGLWNSQESYFFTSIHEFSKLSNEGISTYHQKVGNLKPLIWNDQPYFIIIPHNNPIQIFKINHEAN
ncbi:FG-GAP-like repeat-containing protein [Flavobacteriaceae bacterium]|nr:FG-GAP-like repeat-containing protein [Flavobacteriaceae bacterium]